VGGVSIGWPLQIAAFEAFLRVATSAARAEAPAIGLSPAERLKREGLDRGVRSLTMRALAPRSLPQRGAGRILFVSEVPTPSMIEPSVLAAKALTSGEVEVAVADPRALRIWRRHGYNPRPVLLPWRQEAAGVVRGRREARQTWRRFLASDPRFHFSGLDVTRASLRELRPVVLNSAPWLPVELAALRAIVERLRPAALVVATDQHRIGRLAAVVARETGATLVVLQHGLPQTPIAFLPVVADCVAVWSDDVRSWFLAHGTAPERLVVTGNPRLDRLAASSKHDERLAVSAMRGLSGDPRLLIALSPLDVATNTMVVSMALQAIRDRPSSSAVIKLHPAHRDDRYITDLVRQSGVELRVRILRNEPLLPLLSWADLTLLFRSSVALESLAAGTPVVVADVGGASIAHDELRSLDLPLVRTADGLSTALSEFASKPGLRTYFAKRAGTLERQVGPLDGASATRLADLLRSFQSRS
jgi:hypothetical protein